MAHLQRHGRPPAGRSTGLLHQALVFLYILSGITLPSFAIASTSTVGINYGMVADNLPSPEVVVRLVQSISVTKLKLFSTNSTVLQAFASTGISFIVGIGNEDVASLADPETASNWVQEHIATYLPNTQIVGIAVGNEVFTGNDTQVTSSLLPAMQNLHSALVVLGLDSQVAISTPHSLAILSSSYPPSAGAFRSDLATTYIKPLLDFLTQTGAPFMINAYPYFAYKANSQTVSLAYALFESNAGVTDSGSGLQYYNLLDAQVDAIYTALQALGYQNVNLIVTETGWPSAGDADEAGATIQNAQLYNANLIQYVASKKGTPLRPNQPIEAYIFALFNEDLKTGPTSERNYGLFEPDGQKVYDFGLDYPVSSTLYSVSSSSGKLEPILMLCVVCVLVSLMNSIVVDRSFMISMQRRDKLL